MKNRIFTGLFLLFSVFSFSQEEMSVIDLFGRLPEEAFNKTTEGVTSTDTEALIYVGESDFWEVKTRTKDELAFSAGDQGITILKIYTKDYQMAAVHCVNAQSSDVEIWVYDSEKYYLEKQDLLPNVYVKDFFSEEYGMKLPDDYVGSVSYYVEYKKIKASLYTWMVPELEDIVIRYEIIAVWKDGEFIVSKTIIENVKDACKKTATGCVSGSGH